MAFLLTCEHGGNKIPEEYVYLFKNRKTVLKSHRGWDPGALELAKIVSRELSAPLVYSEISRLVIDLNRSLHHPGVFSEFTNILETTKKQELINSIYSPYRTKVRNKIDEFKSGRHPTVHLSFHSFTPVLDGQTRQADIGLLYDPARNLETRFCRELQSGLQDKFPDLTIRRNYPYRGNADGLITSLRAQFSEHTYAGIEIEVNQKHTRAGSEVWKQIRRNLGRVLLATRL